MRPDLDAGGTRLWDAITDAHDLDAAQVAQLVEACRARDRLDRLDALLKAGADSVLLRDANRTAKGLAQLLAALRLPDPVTGRRPQFRGPRGVQAPSVPGGRAR